MTELPIYMYRREFDAPLARVWKTWTDPVLLAQWYGPGVETIIHAYDLRPGGHWLNEMKWSGNSHYSRMDFVEVQNHDKLVWNHSSTNSEWVIAANEMMPDWPKTLLTTVTFSDKGATSSIKLEQVPVDASEAEIACFAKMMGGMDNGWGKGFDLFADILKNQGA